jgi:Tol biopolymer transport system component
VVLTQRFKFGLLIVFLGFVACDSTSGPGDSDDTALEALPFAVMGSGTLLFERILPTSAVVYHVEITERRSSVAFDRDDPIMFGAVISTDGRKVAYTGPLAGSVSHDLFMADLVTGIVSRLTSTDAFEGVPTWTPDGNNLVFYRSNPISYVLGTGFGGRQVMGTSTEGGLFVCPHPEYAVQAVISTRDELAVPCGSGLYRIAPDGVTTVRVFFTENAAVWAPAWSADGERIALIEVHNNIPTVLSIRRDGSELQTLATVPVTAATAASAGINAYSLCWSADNSRVFFTIPEAGGRAHVWMARADGTTLTQITSRSDASDKNVSCAR